MCPVRRHLKHLPRHSGNAGDGGKRRSVGLCGDARYCILGGERGEERAEWLDGGLEFAGEDPWELMEEPDPLLA